MALPLLANNPEGHPSRKNGFTRGRLIAGECDVGQNQDWSQEQVSQATVCNNGPMPGHSSMAGNNEVRSLEPAEAEGVFEEEHTPQDGCGEQQRVDAVEDAAVAGQHGAGVLDAGAALDRRLQQVA